MKEDMKESREGEKEERKERKKDGRKEAREEWRKEHTFFEQYSDINGKGLKSRNFNGWTSLIINIITERYDS